jgi:N utilization substance protein B
MSAASATSRRQARRAALVLLYQHDVSPDRSFDELFERYAGDAGVAVPDYARALVADVTREHAALDAEIERHAHGWQADRIAPIERAALRIAVLELTARPDVPAAVAIDEAVGLAKRYASPEAAVFVNGVLGAVARAHGVGR